MYGQITSSLADNNINKKQKFYSLPERYNTRWNGKLTDPCHNNDNINMLNEELKLRN